MSSHLITDQGQLPLSVQEVGVATHKIHSCCGVVDASYTEINTIRTGVNAAVEWNLTCIAAVFALGILSQALVLGAIPLAGWMIAPSKEMATYPFAILLFGSVIGGFLAPRITGILGVSGIGLSSACAGVSGALLLGLSILDRNFNMLCCAALLLGFTNAATFSLRHVAAHYASKDNRMNALGGFIGVGALAGFFGGPLASAAERWFDPYMLVGTSVVIGVISLASVILSFYLPQEQVLQSSANINEPIVSNIEQVNDIPIKATLLSAFSWFTMTAMMAYAPIGMKHCGISIGSSTTMVAWHVVAMYAPAAFAAPLLKRISPYYIAAAGAIIVLFAAMIILNANSIISFSLALIGLGIGWSLNMVATQAWIFKNRAPSVQALSRYEMLLFTAAMCGAIVSGQLFVNA